MRAAVARARAAVGLPRVARVAGARVAGQRRRREAREEALPRVAVELAGGAVAAMLRAWRPSSSNLFVKTILDLESLL